MDDHEMMDLTIPTDTIPILGSSQSSPRSPRRSRPRHYPESATEWTEYNSPLLNPQINFCIDVVGDRSPQSNASCNEPRDSSSRGVHSLTPIPGNSASVAATGDTLVDKDPKPGLADVPVIKLSPEQQHVLDLVRSGQKYVFIFHLSQRSQITSILISAWAVCFSQVLQVLSLPIFCYIPNATSPGTGKSVLLREIISLLRSRNLVDRVAITASTGIAGLNIGGSTVHSFAGIGLGKESAEVLAQRISKSKFPRKRWLDTSTLIIDESKCCLFCCCGKRSVSSSPL